MGAALRPEKREQLIKEKETKITKNIDAETAATIKAEKKRIREEYMAILRQNSQVSQKNPYARASQTNIYGVDFQNRMRTLLSPPGTQSPGNPLGLPGLDDNGNLRPGAVWGGVPGAGPENNAWGNFPVKTNDGKYRGGTQVNAAAPDAVKGKKGVATTPLQELWYRTNFNPDGTERTPSDVEGKKAIAEDLGMKKKKVAKAAKIAAKEAKQDARDAGATKKEAKQAGKAAKADVLDGGSLLSVSYPGYGATPAATPTAAAAPDLTKKEVKAAVKDAQQEARAEGATKKEAKAVGKDVKQTLLNPAPMAPAPVKQSNNRIAPPPGKDVIAAATAPAPPTASLLGASPTNKAEDEVALAIDPKKKKASNTAVRAAGSGSKSLLSTRTQMK